MHKTMTVGAALVIALTAAAGHNIEATHSSSSVAVVLKWNQLLQSTLPQPGNPGTPRFYSMMHIAMFDAINAIERDFEPYRVRLRPGLGGSTTAAAAQAAHDVLVVLNPSAVADYDEALAADLGDHPSGFVRRGAGIGAHVAKEILAWRQNDGWVVSAFPPYAEPPLPGRWQPTPPANAAATFTHLQHAAPMALLSARCVCDSLAFGSRRWLPGSDSDSLGARTASSVGGLWPARNQAHDYTCPRSLPRGF